MSVWKVKIGSDYRGLQPHFRDGVSAECHLEILQSSS